MQVLWLFHLLNSQLPQLLQGSIVLKFKVKLIIKAQEILKAIFQIQQEISFLKKETNFERITYYTV